jgi:endonuclease YncB( thermonuclease family)
MPKWTRGGHALGPRWPRLRGIPLTFVAIVAFAGLAWLAAKLDPLPPRFTGVAQAADGDSLRVQGDRIRLLGIDAPELDQVCWYEGGKEWSCGHAARAELARLVAAGPVDCQPEGTDKYGRTLAVCTIAHRDIGAAVVEAGFALARDAYGAEESAAKKAKRGLWDGRFVDPRTWRDEGPSNDPGPGLFENLWNWFRELTGARTLR